jgi:Arc/MetJ-type ribon-helix-helix transcriptional regulator
MPKKIIDTVPVSVRISPADIKAIDKIADAVKDEYGRNISRADVIRKAVQDYIEKNLPNKKIAVDEIIDRR